MLEFSLLQFLQMDLWNSFLYPMFRYAHLDVGPLETICFTPISISCFTFFSNTIKSIHEKKINCNLWMLLFDPDMFLASSQIQLAFRFDEGSLINHPVRVVFAFLLRLFKLDCCCLILN